MRVSIARAAGPARAGRGGPGARGRARVRGVVGARARRGPYSGAVQEDSHNLIRLNQLEFG